MAETDPPLWEVLARLAAELPAEEAAKLPANLAATIGHEWERIAALEAVMRALVATDPPATKCWHCGAPGVMTMMHDGATVRRTSVHMAHTPDCPVVVGRALLAGKEG